MRTISRRLFLSMILLLAVVTGSVGILYSVTTRQVYLKEQCRMLEQAYEEIQKQDIALLCQSSNQKKNSAEEDELEELESGILTAYENDNMRFRIRNEAFELLYATSKQAQAKDESVNPEQRKRRMAAYEEQVSAVYEDMGETGRVILRGKCRQQGRTYYIMITESTSLIDRTTRSVKQVLLLTLVLFLILGAVVVRFLAQGIGKSVANAVRVAGKIANKDFSERLEEKTGYQELDELGNSINEMSDQIQSYIQDMESYNRMLKQDNERRMELEKHRKQFVNNVSHEMKTPLAIISSQAELIPLIKEERKRQQYCDSVIEETRKMSQMIQSMLRIFAVEQGLENVPMEEFDLGEAAEEVIMSFGGAFEKKHFKVRKELEADCRIVGDKENICRAMSNYLMNAWRYAPEYGNINISVKKESGNAVFAVYNQGNPVEEKDQSRIWDSFYRGDSPGHGSSQEGTGLGLYIVKSIVSQHKGLCSVANKPEGVEFEFRIPLAESIENCDCR